VHSATQPENSLSDSVHSGWLPWRDLRAVGRWGCVDHGRLPWTVRTRGAVGRFCELTASMEAGARIFGVAAMDGADAGRSWKVLRVDGERTRLGSETDGRGRE
jgi:hypothetical protein